MSRSYHLEVEIEGVPGRFLAERAEKETHDMTAILTELRTTILAELRQPEIVQLQLAGFSTAEQEQFERNMSALAERAEQMDAYAKTSTERAVRASKGGDFKEEITPVTVKGRKGDEVVSDDETPFNVNVEKIAFSAFYMSRLEWVLRKSGIEHLYFTGIVTNGGVASTVRDAHVREFHCTVVADGCAAFSRDLHEAAIAGMQPVAKVITVADAMAAFAAL